MLSKLFSGFTRLRAFEMGQMVCDSTKTKKHHLKYTNKKLNGWRVRKLDACAVLAVTRPPPFPMGRFQLQTSISSIYYTLNPYNIGWRYALLSIENIEIAWWSVGGQVWTVGRLILLHRITRKTHNYYTAVKFGAIPH